MSTAADRENKLKQVYYTLDRKYEEEETQRKSKKLKLPYLNLFGFPVDTSAISLVPRETSEQLEVVVFYKEGRNLKLGFVNPSQAINDLVKTLVDQSYYVDSFIISESSFKHVFKAYDNLIDTRKQGEVKIAQEHNESLYKISSLKELTKRLLSVSATELVDHLLGAALALSSSDVHVEPESKGIKIRYRIDGVLQDVATLPSEHFHQLISRIKILSKLKLNVTTAPQDGSFSLTYNKQPVDIRVSVLPTAYGESIVMRILRQDKGCLKFEDLGIEGYAKERLLAEIGKTNGMVLTTGPTGSGKTT